MHASVAYFTTLSVAHDKFEFGRCRGLFRVNTTLLARRSLQKSHRTSIRTAGNQAEIWFSHSKCKSGALPQEPSQSVSAWHRDRQSWISKQIWACKWITHSSISIWAKWRVDMEKVDGETVLGTFDKLEYRILASSCPSIRMEQIGSQLTVFHETWYFMIFHKHVGKTPVPLKYDNKNRYFTLRLKYIYDNIDLSSC
jgi:hypothetical protein